MTRDGNPLLECSPTGNIEPQRGTNTKKTPAADDEKLTLDTTKPNSIKEGHDAYMVHDGEEVSK